MHKKIRFLTYAAMVAALYAALTWLSNLFGLASGVIQVRLSEALTVLPAFFPAAIPGLTVGCVLANILTGCAMWDVVFGSLATLLGAIGTFLLRKKNKFLAPLPPILANTLIVPPVLRFVYGAEDAYWFMTLTVCAGEIISCGIIGMIVYYAAQRAGLDKLDAPKQKS